MPGPTPFNPPRLGRLLTDDYGVIGIIERSDCDRVRNLGEIMEFRLTKVSSEENLRLCFSRGLWGSRTSRIQSWRPGDLLAIYTGRRLAALGVVAGAAFRADEAIWPDHAYPHRVRMNYHMIIPERLRPSMEGPVKQALWEDLGKHWAFHATIVGRPLRGPAVAPILDALEAADRSRGRKQTPPGARMAEWRTRTGVERATGLEERLARYL